jgi:hypothetical protein
MTGEQLKKAVAEFEAERNQKKAYEAALAKVRRMRRAGKTIAEILEWAARGIGKGRRPLSCVLVSSASPD